MVQNVILSSHSPVISVWTGRCCLYPQETWVFSPIKSRQKILTTRLVMGTNFRYGPAHVPEGPLHRSIPQMRLKHPTWFNGALVCDVILTGNCSLTGSIMLKRSPGLKVHRVPGSTIELPQGSFATWGFGSGCSCLPRGIEPEGVVEIRV